jgi:hypothetical protein
MCRPPCCNDSGGQGTGIAAVAIIIGAALIAAKIGPIVTRIVHTAVEVIRLAALTTSVVVALGVVTWAGITITRWQLHRRAQLTASPSWVAAARLLERTEPADRPECLACGGTGMVLRAISGGRYQPQDCPVCEPARMAG